MIRLQRTVQIHSFEAEAIVAIGRDRPEFLAVARLAADLGHPIGASGARVMVTLLAALQKYDLKRGVASLCIGGGEATAIALERVA